MLLTGECGFDGFLVLSLICHCKDFCLIICNCPKFSAQSIIFCLESSCSYYCTNLCNIETVKVVIFLRILWQGNNVVSHLRDLCFTQILTTTTCVILHKLHKFSELWECEICCCDWHSINNHKMVVITTIPSECPLIER